MNSITLSWETWRAVITVVREKALPSMREHATVIEEQLERNGPDEPTARSRQRPNRPPANAPESLRRDSGAQADQAGRENRHSPHRSTGDVPPHCPRASRVRHDEGAPDGAPSLLRLGASRDRGTATGRRVRSRDPPPARGYHSGLACYRLERSHAVG